MTTIGSTDKFGAYLNDKWSDRFVHISISPITEVKPTFSPDNDNRPSCFWYTVGGFWINFTRREIPQIFKQMSHAYHIEIKQSSYTNSISDRNKDKVLRVDSKRVLAQLDRAYGFTIRQNKRLVRQIDWVELSQDFAGIEFMPYFPLDLDVDDVGRFHWYYTIDFPSGCLFNSKPLKSIDLIAKKNKTGRWTIQ